MELFVLYFVKISLNISIQFIVKTKALCFTFFDMSVIDKNLPKTDKKMF